MSLVTLMSVVSVSFELFFFLPSFFCRAASPAAITNTTKEGVMATGRPSSLAWRQRENTSAASHTCRTHLTSVPPRPHWQSSRYQFRPQSNYWEGVWSGLWGAVGHLGCFDGGENTSPAPAGTDGER